MLVMPGGADLPYCRQLNGKGNALIRGEGLKPSRCTGSVRTPKLMHSGLKFWLPGCFT